MRKIVATALALALLAGCRSSSAPTAAPKKPRPRAIVLITIDTLRADAVSLTGESELTPFLRSLAADALVFSRAYSTSSWTAPALASLMTGLWPQTHGIRRGMVNRLGTTSPRSVVTRQPQLSDSFETLAERLKASGFATIGVAANLHVSVPLGFAQGFDQYWAEGFIDARAVTSRALYLLKSAYGSQWQERWRTQPTFLWVHYFDPHMPYEARRPWITKLAPDFDTHPEAYPDNLDARVLIKTYRPATIESMRPLHALYLSEVSYIDDQLRKLNEQLHFDDPDVMVIFTADHGEEFGEHQGVGHANTLYDEVVKIPLFVRWPAGLPPTRQIDQPVSIVDLYPTIAALLGEPLQAQGQPLPLQRDGDPLPRPLFLVTDRARPSLAGVIDGRWKLLRRQSRTKSDYQLYDLLSDPAELSDQSEAKPEVAHRLAKLLSEQADQLPPPPDDPAPPTDPVAAERLRALGYD